MTHTVYSDPKIITWLSDFREAVEKADRSKKAAAAALLEAKEQAGLLSTQNTALHNQKRKLELQLQMIASEVEESFEEAKLAMEKSKKANFECAQLGEEYKKATDQTEFLAKTKSSLDAEVKSLQDRIAEQEEFNVKGSKRSIQRLQVNIVENFWMITLVLGWHKWIGKQGRRKTKGKWRNS